jgi:hypothetical protein
LPTPPEKPKSLILLDVYGHLDPGAGVTGNIFYSHLPPELTKNQPEKKQTPAGN